MRRCGKRCYVVDIYWTGVLRASETLSIAEWKCLLFERDFQGFAWGSSEREGRDGRAEGG